MVIFLNLDGSCENVTPQKVYQGSNNVTEITVVSPFPSTTEMQIGFVLPDGLYWETAEHARYAPMEFVPQETVSGVNVWKFILPFSVTAKQGDLYIAVNATTTDGNTTSYMVKQIIEESVLPNAPNPPELSVYDYLSLYLARLDGRTENVANLVADIQKVAPNAFTFTKNNGIESAPIVIEGGDTAPIPVNAASTVKIPLDAWQPVYSGQTVTGYSALITAAMHGQMRDGATVNDLWVSFDETDNGVILGAYQGYTVNDEGDITISVNQPIAMTVRVWNGKGLVDDVAREMIEKETERAEAEEAHLQEQIDELHNTGVDLVARERITQEIERATAAEESLRTAITDEAERATAAENELTADVQDLRDQLGQKVSKSGDTMDGDLRIKARLNVEKDVQCSGLGLHYTTPFIDFYLSNDGGKTGAKLICPVDGKLTCQAELYENDVRVYSPNNPPPLSVPPAAEPTTRGTVYGTTDPDDGTAFGYEAIARVGNVTAEPFFQHIAIGNNAKAHSYYGGTIVIGDSAEAGGYDSSIVIGAGAKTSAYYGDIIIGNGSKNTFAGGPAGDNVIIGHDRITDESHVVILGSNSVQKLYCHVTTITQLSDTRLKEEIEPADIDRCLDDVNRLPVTRYKYKDFVGKSRDKHVTGFLADDVEKVFPKSVSSSKKTFYEYDENGEYIEEPDVNENGEPILYENGEPQMRRKSFVMNDVKDITMTEAIPTLWGAVQSLSKTVKEQQKQIAELKERMSALEVNHGAKN